MMTRAAKNDRQAPQLACFGAINQDIKAHSLGPVTLGSSNPAQIHHSDGGVARNVAEALATLGARVDLVSRVGNDPSGDALIHRLQERGVATGRVSRSSSAPTATYTALLGPEGDLAVAFAEMDILDELTAETVMDATRTLDLAGYWFADCNLSTDALARLQTGRPKGTMLAVDTVSVAKAPRLRPLLPKLDILFTNQAELAALTGRAVNAPLEVVEAAAVIRALGTAMVVVAMGSTGVFLTTEGFEDFKPALPATVLDVTGAGDALMAATLMALAQGETPKTAVHLGMAAAAFTTEVPETVHQGLSMAALRERASFRKVA